MTDLESDTTPQIFLARQPILDRAGQLVGFELLFRSANTQSAGVIDDVHATASVIANMLSAIGLKHILGEHLGFVNFSAELLLSDVVELLPARQIVLEVLETVQIDDKIIERLAQLKRKGFKIALDDIVTMADVPPALRDIVDVVKLELPQIRPDQLAEIVRQVREWPVQLLAEKVDTREQVEACKQLGFDLFQGYYFARPQTVTGKRPDPSKLALLRLLGIMSGDATDQKIEEELKRHPALTLNLLRLVNSAGAGAGQKVGSIKQGIIVLGRKQLQRWVQLLLYANSSVQAGRNPLMHTVAVRAKLMENIATQQFPRDPGYGEHAFLTGILSLLDVLLGVPIPDILAELSIPEEVESALLTRTGRMAPLLSLIEQKEASDVASITQAASAIGVSLSALAEAELNALSWANAVTEA